MNRRTAVCVFLCSFVMAASANAASNLAECILDKMPGAKNDQFAREVMAECSQKFGSTYSSYTSDYVGQKWGIFGFKSGAECTLAKSKDTISPIAAATIRTACYRLYEPE